MTRVELQNKNSAAWGLYNGIGVISGPTDPGYAPAATKQLSNLLRSMKWQIELIVEFYWQQSDQIFFR